VAPSAPFPAPPTNSRKCSTQPNRHPPTTRQDPCSNFLYAVEELATLTEAMPERLRLMVTLASWCALRFGETVELRRGDVDPGAEVIRIRRAAVRTKGADTITTPKSDASVRDVAIPPHIIPHIEDHLAKYVDAKRDSLLFAAEHGGHLQPSTVYRHWYRARAAAGRSDLRWHDLRHSGAVLAAATGATLAELMARLGHSTPAAAMRYQHAAQGRDREIAASLSSSRTTGSCDGRADQVRHRVRVRRLH
jgi:integrase